MGSIAAHHGLLFVGGLLVAQYWDPLANSSEITLSNSNKTATRSTTNNGSWRSVKSVTSHSSGKWYAECVNDANGSTNGAMIFGVGKAAASLSSYPGSDANSWGNQANNPGVFFYLAGSASDRSASISSIASGGYAKLAVDFDNGRIYFGTSTTSGGGGWGSGVDPTSGAGAITFTAGTQLWLMLGEQQSPEQTTLRTAAADMAGTIPSGFSAWG